MINKNKSAGQNDAWFIAGLIFLVALMIAPNIDHIIQTNHILFKNLVAVIGVGLLLIYRLISHRHLPTILLHLSPARYALSAMLLLGCLSVFWSSNIDFTLSKLLLWFVATGLMVYSFGFRHSLVNFTPLVWGLFLTAVVVSAIGALQYLELFHGVVQLVPPASTFGNKNIANHVLVLLLPLGLFLLFNTTSKKQLALLALGLPIIFAYIFYTQTRSAWLSVGIELMAIIIYATINRQTLAQYWHKNKTYTMIAIIALTGILVNLSSTGWHSVLGVIDQRVSSIVQDSQSHGSGRFPIWQQALVMIEQKPILGSGLGTFANNIANQTYPVILVKETQRVHNDLLELGVELGLVAWLIFIAIIIALWHCIVLLMRHQQGINRLFYFIIFTALLGSSVNMLLSFAYQLILPMLLFVLYVSILIKGSDSHNPYQSTISFLLGKKTFYGLLVGLIVAFTLGLVIVISWIKSYDNINQYLTDLRQAKYSANLNQQPIIYNHYIPNTIKTMARQMKIGKVDIGVLKSYQAILVIYPHSQEALFELGNLYAKINKPLLSEQYFARLMALPPNTHQQIKIIDALLAHQQLTLALKFFKQFAQNVTSHKFAQPEVINLQTAQAIIRLAILLNRPKTEILAYYQQYGADLLNESIENNMIFYYVKNKDYLESVPHIYQMLKLDKNHINRPTYEQILKKYGQPIPN